MSVRDRIQHELETIEAAGQTRRLFLPQGRDFTSSDYLGLSRHPEVIGAALEATQTYGAGAPGSRLLGGHYPVHAQVEQQVANWCGCEAALLFTSGWQANAALLGALIRPGDRVLSDALNHASLIDACRLTKAITSIFPHLDLSTLEAELQARPHPQTTFIITESIYSMDGDAAPLAAYIELAEKYDAYIIVDEAHAVGLYGPEGQGCLGRLPSSPRILARTLTAGKSMGVSGAMVVAEQLVIDAIINRGRNFLYTTAIAPGIAGAIGKSVELIQTHPELRALAFERANQLRTELKRRLGDTCPVLGESPIVPIILGSEARAMAVAETLQNSGFEVRAVRPPTVPVGTSRIRVVCHANHSEEDILALAQALEAAMRLHPSKATAAPSRAVPRTAWVVLGTDTDVGKTAVSALLTQYFLRQGPTRYLKPVQTGSDSDTQTVQVLTALSDNHMHSPIVSLDLPASVDQAADAEGVTVQVKTVATQVQALLEAHTTESWVIETAGGLLVPFNEAEDQSQLVQALHLPTVLVARSGLGTLNHTLLTLEAASRRRIQVIGVLLVGPPHEANLKTLRGRHPHLPFVHIPHLSPLDQTTLAHWLDEGGEVKLHEVFK